MKKFLSALAALALAAGLGTAGAMPAQAADPIVGTIGTLLPWSAPTNQASYWTSYGDHAPSECVAGNDTYGSVTDGGLTVTLNAFQDAWPGDHFELLVVKGGSVSNNVIVHPTAGVPYASPVNDGGQQSTVSHWIVCFGTTPPTPTTVTPEYSSTQQSCDVAQSTISVTLKNGISYALTGAVVGVVDISSGSSGPLLPDTYTLTAVDSDPNDLFTGTPLNVPIVITAFTGSCNELTPVTPDATFVDESCDVESQVLTKGVITVDLSVVGVTYTITQAGNPVAFHPVTGKTGELTTGLTYIVTATANPGYKLTDENYEEQFTPFSKAVDCTTLPGVTPLASQDPGCELPSFFTIGNTLFDPTAISWTANGAPISEGKHLVNGAVTITLVATAGPGFGMEGDPQTEWTFTFPKNETCGDLKTLALTGAADTTPALALTAFLGLLGLAMVRSGMRVNRNRQEA